MSSPIIIPGNGKYGHVVDQQEMQLRPLRFIAKLLQGDVALALSQAALRAIAWQAQDILPGDVLLTAAQGGGLLSSQILFWTKGWFEEPSIVSHAGVIVSPATYFNDVLLIEQTWPKLRRNALGFYLEGLSDVFIFRDKRLDEAQRLAIACVAEEALSETASYGVGKIGLFLGDAILGKTLSLPAALVARAFGKRLSNWEPRLLTRIDLTKTYVCSQFVAKLLYDVAELDYGRPWLEVNPDDLWDFVRKSGHFDLVYARTTSAEAQKQLDALVPSRAA